MIRFKPHNLLTTLLVSVLLLIACAALCAQTFSHILSFQGRLCEPNGKPLPDGPYQVQFTIYDAETEGEALWQETQEVTQVGGVFSVYLGTQTPFPADLFTDGDRWLALQIIGDVEIPERFRLAPSPWAIHAANSDKVDGFDASSTPTGRNLVPLDEDGKFPLETIPQGPGSGLDADTLDGYDSSDLLAMGEPQEYVELAPTQPQTGAAVDLVGTGWVPTVRLENEGLALAARTTQTGWVSAWWQMSPPASPLERDSVAMAYDAESDQTIVFGGRDSNRVPLGETWAYDHDADTWTQMSSGPPARAAAAAAYDTLSDRVILFGGQDIDSQPLRDTWAYDYNADIWEQMNPLGDLPFPRAWHAMAYDELSDRVILYGGTNLLGDTWAYDYEQDIWLRRTPSGPGFRWGAAMAYDKASDRVILFGGEAFFLALNDETWAYNYDKDEWERMHPENQGDIPSARSYGAMAYERISNRAVLFGGQAGGGSTLGDSWAYDYKADEWRVLDPASSPPARSRHGMAYDAQSLRLILFGGYDGAGMLDDTWVFGRYDARWVADLVGDVQISGDLDVGGTILGRVENADYADNSDQVDGFDASQTPTPNTILPLDAQGKIPLDVIEGPFPPDDDWTISGDDIYRLEGNVGIGTTQPAAKLDIRDEGDPAAAPVLYVNRPNNLGDPDPSLAGMYIKDHEANYPLHILSLPTGVPLLTVRGDGNVGIGTTTPYSRLTVAGPISVYGGALTGDTYQQANISAGDREHFLFEAPVVDGVKYNTYFSHRGGGVNMVITGTGRVGIGTTTPEVARLHVVGLPVPWGSPKAGYFEGDVYITGKLTKGSGAFKIDHPLNPENKYLSHSFVESPDMMNVYNGNVVLGAGGEAWVEFPEWFEALNRNFRYQLTCIGGFAPVYVAEEISGNAFRIAGGEPGMKVSWQVTGIRRDPYAVAHPIVVEEEKPPHERGKYLHPEVYGQPKTKAIGTADSASLGAR